MNFCTLLLTPFPSVSCLCPRHEEHRQIHCEGQLNADDKEGKSKSLGGRVTCRGHLRCIGPHRRQRPLATWSTSRANTCFPRKKRTAASGISDQDMLSQHGPNITDVQWSATSLSTTSSMLDSARSIGYLCCIQCDIITISDYSPHWLYHFCIPDFFTCYVHVYACR